MIPKELGFRMPAEFEEHDATWLSWPHNKETWSDIGLIEKTYFDIVNELIKGEKVNILVSGDLKFDNSNVRIFNIKTCDAWIRDYGPNFVVNQNEVAMNNWNFNAWGNKYEEMLVDNGVNEKINVDMGLKIFRPGIVLEGGAIDVNGDGMCMVTEQCLLNKNRNPCLSKEEIEKYLMDYLNVKEIIWLKGGVEGDDTDGHIDDVARFVNKNTILISSVGKSDPNFDVLDENIKILEKINGLSIIKIPMPEGFNRNHDFKFPGSYVNFYIGNKSVLVPVFNDDTDRVALEIIKEQFPDKNVKGINCKKLVEGFGSIHCITQQQPKI